MQIKKKEIANMKLSTSINVLFGIGPVKEQLTRVYNAGFRNMDICFGDWSGDYTPWPESPFVQDSWKEWVGVIKEFGNQNGVTFNQGHAPIYNIFDEDERGKRLEQMSLRSVEAAGMLGIPWLVFHAGTRPGPYLREDIKKLREDNLRWYDKILNRAAAVGVGIALENMSDRFGKQGEPGCYCSDTEDLIDLVDSFHSPHVGICWDTGHAHLQQVDQVRSIRQIGGRLKALHIQDGNGLSDQHTAPFYGTIDWNPILGAIKDVGYDGCFTFEAHMLIRPVPNSCKDDAIRLLYSIGRELVARLESMS